MVLKNIDMRVVAKMLASNISITKIAEDMGANHFDLCRYAIDLGLIRKQNRKPVLRAA
jgi:hypothetical protein